MWRSCLRIVSVGRFSVVLVVASLATFSFTTNVAAQTPPAIEWELALTDTIGKNSSAGIVLDAVGNLYVTGSAATAKFDPSGQLLWTTPYGGLSVELESANRLRVISNARIRTLDTDGNLIREVTLTWPNVGQMHILNNLAFDAAGNIYAVGRAWIDSNRNYDYFTAKFDALGNRMWIVYYDGQGGFDVAAAVAVDSSGNIYVTGMSQVGPLNGVVNEMLTLKYSASGELHWAARYVRDEPVARGGAGQALALDGSGHLYVTGTTATVKYSIVDGSAAWVRLQPGNAMKFDALGNIVIVGKVCFGFGDWPISGGCVPTEFNVVKFSPVGAMLWSARHPTGPYDILVGFVLDGTGHTYLAVNSAPSSQPPRTHRFVRFDGNGNMQWAATYPSGNISGFAIDASGAIYVGRHPDEARSNTLLVKYSQLNAPSVADVAVVVSPSIFPLSGGAAWVWHWIGVSNWGPNLATGVSVSESVGRTGKVLLSDGYVTVHPEWSCTTAEIELTCARASPMPAGQTDWIGQWIYVLPGNSGNMVSGTGYVRTTSSDPFLLNNTSTGSVFVP